MPSGHRDCNYRAVALLLSHEEGISFAYDVRVAVGAGKVQDWMRMLGFYRKNRTMAETRISGLGHMGNDHSDFLDHRMIWLKTTVEEP